MPELSPQVRQASGVCRQTVSLKSI